MPGNHDSIVCYESLCLMRCRPSWKAAISNLSWPKGSHGQGAKGQQVHGGQPENIGRAATCADANHRCNACFKQSILNNVMFGKLVITIGVYPVLADEFTRWYD